MENPNSPGGNYWGTLINSDKSPAPLLEELCIGLAQLMVGLMLLIYHVSALKLIRTKF
jgi:hypothetical protein